MVRRLCTVGVLVAACAACASTNTPVATTSSSVTVGRSATTITAAALLAGESTLVERVVDGDTIVVSGRVHVRLIGVNTPETVDPRKPVECFGRAASDYVHALLPPGTRVRLVYDVDRFDRYGRTLAYVYRTRDNLFVNADLVRRGYAEVATYPPDVAHVDEFVALERAARAAGRGLWRACR